MEASWPAWVQGYQRSNFRESRSPLTQVSQSLDWSLCMRKPWYSIFLMVLLVNVLWLVPAQAQERKGTIAGHVTDADHAVLQGARVELQPSGRTFVSDAQGQFTISDLAPGHYT